MRAARRRGTAAGTPGPARGASALYPPAMSPVLGLHHVTAISGPAQETVDFYAARLGLRLVKQTVNFDDPGTYHLYFADGDAAPGSVMTFFPWTNAAPGRIGAGQATATAWAVPRGAVGAWAEQTDGGGVSERFGDAVLTVHAPDGLVVELVEADAPAGQWTGGGVPLDRALGGFAGATLCSLAPDATARVLTDALGYREVGQEADRVRFVNERAPRAGTVDLYCSPFAQAGRMGTGTVHHVAFRVPDDEAEREVRERLRELGLQPTGVIDRQYFHSVYAREPGGILFEIATENPGFAVDEPADALGRALRLPPQYEPQRDDIRARLPELRLPY